MNINDFLDSLLNSRKNRGEPLVSAPIVRSEKYLEKLKSLQESEVWIEFLQNTYQLIVNPKPRLRYRGMHVGFYKSDLCNGFYLSAIEHFEIDWFRILSDRMKNVLVADNYKVTSHITEYSEQNNQQVCWEKMYLKPGIRQYNAKTNQQYGKIQLEVKIVNNRPSLFKVQVNAFSGHNYHPALPYSALLTALFEERS